MSRNTILALIAVASVLVLALGGGYWGYKKMKQRANLEYRCEGKMQVGAGFEIETFKGMILDDSVLDQVVEEKDLVARWGVSDVEEAKLKIRGEFNASVIGQELSISYQDKDKALAKKILQALLDTYQKSINGPRETGSLPQ